MSKRVYYRKFDEPSKSLSIKVPESKYDYLKKLFYDIVEEKIDISKDGENIENNGEYQELLKQNAESNKLLYHLKEDVKKYIKIVNNTINAVQNILEEEDGYLTPDEYNQIINTYDWDFCDALEESID